MLATYSYRVMRAMTLDPSLFEEVEHDRRAAGGALATVLLAAAAAGVGAGGWHGVSARTFAIFSAIALVSWSVWTVITLEVGTRLLSQPQTRASYSEVWRTIGFAAAPGVLLVFAAFPVVTTLVFALVIVWMLAAMVLAVRQTLDYDSTNRAVVVCALGLSIAVAVAATLGLIFTQPVF